MLDIPASLLSSAERAPWGWVLTLVVILAIIKVWPVIQLQTITAKAALRGERKDELDDCKSRLDAFDKRLTAATAQIHQLDLKLVGAVAAYRILHNDTLSRDPESEALMQAQTVFRAHFDGAVPAGGVAS